MLGKNVVIAAGMALVVVAGFVLAKSLPSGDDGAEPELRAGGSGEPVTEAARVVEGTGTSTAGEGAKTSTAQQQEARAVTREILEALDELERCAQHWEEQVVPLLTNKHGTLLAYDATLVSRFTSLYVRVDTGQIRGTIESMRGTMREFTALLEAVDDAYAPSEQFLADMGRAKERVAALLATCGEAHGAIEDLLSAAQRRTPAATETTLEEAMAGQGSSGFP